MTDDDLPARYRNAWREAYAENRALAASARRRFAAVALVTVLAGLSFGLSALFLRAALHDAPAADLAFAIITGLRK
jgi:hypothetical protein